MHRFLKTQLSKISIRKPTLVIGAVLIALIMVLLALSHFHSAPASPGAYSDLLYKQDWTHLAGADSSGQEVHIMSLGRAIVNQDGSYGQANPPVNVRGPHLKVNGDFQIKLQAKDIPDSGQAQFYMYSSPPIIYDEWRYEPPHVLIAVSRENVTLQIWDGNSDVAIAQKSWPTNLDQNSTITISYTDKNFFIDINAQKQFKTKNHAIFNNSNVWFGFDASKAGLSWTLASLKAAPLGESQIKIISPTTLQTSHDRSNSLRGQAQQNQRTVFIGTAISNYALFGDSDYRNLAASQFSLLAPENELKAQFVHPQPNIYSFTEADSLVEFAQANNMQVQGHNLVFSEANPRWMQDTPLNKRQVVMSDHITEVVRHYENKINSWDVVDEPLADDETNGQVKLRSNIWQKAMGENYIDVAFNTAHSANPAAKLYINEYGLEQDGAKWDSFLNLIKRLQGRKVPVDGVGFQAHVHEQGDKVDKNVLIGHMEVLAQMGLTSRISEADVYGDNSKIQSQQYANLLSACLAVSSCNSFTTWGVSDRYGSTTEVHTYPLKLGNDLIWDSNLQPKTAYNNLLSVLKNSNP